MVFLAAAAALPDESDPAQERWDLRAYYERHSRYVWTLFALFELMYLSHFIYFIHTSDMAGPSLSFWLRYLVLSLVVFMALAATKSRRLHAGLLGLVFALEVVNSWGDGL